MREDCDVRWKVFPLLFTHHSSRFVTIHLSFSLFPAFVKGLVVSELVWIGWSEKRRRQPALMEIDKPF